MVYWYLHFYTCTSWLLIVLKLFLTTHLSAGGGFAPRKRNVCQGILSRQVIVVVFKKKKRKHARILFNNNPGPSSCRDHVLLGNQKIILRSIYSSRFCVHSFSSVESLYEIYMLPYRLMISFGLWDALII